MSHRHTLPLLLSLPLAFAALPAAAAPEGAYATAFGGGAFQGDQTFDFRNGTSTDRGDASFSGSFISGASIGYGWDSGWRLEGEFAYQSVDMDAGTFSGAGPVGDGNYASTSLAANALYEFNAFGRESARTYLGVGVAFLTEVDADFESGGTERSFSGDGVGLQVLAGARYDLGERWFVDAGVRYLAASSLDLDEEGGGGTIEADYAPWAVTLAVGLRF
jgi:opacity protein-like surface antigen